MGKPGRTSLEFMFQKSQPLSTSQKQMVWLPRSHEALHAPADVSPRAAWLCAGVGTRLRQPAGRGGEGSSAQLRRQMCACLCPLAGGRSDTLPLRAGSAEKPNTSWLLAACRETRLVQHLCENCCCASQRWLFQPLSKRSLLQETAEICLAVLGETAKAEGLCLYRRKFASWAPTLCTGAWKKALLTTHIYTVLLQGPKLSAVSHTIMSFSTQAVAADSACFS